MNKKFNDILDICLERIIFKGETVEKCLESYPTLSEELEPLLRAALSASDIFSVEPRPAFKQAAKARLLSTIATKEEIEEKRRLPSWHWQRRWAVAFSLALVLLIASGSIVTASTSSLPGDTLYPLKTAAEKVQAFFTFGDDAKANLHMKLAERRIEEINLLNERKRHIPVYVLGALQDETNHAITILNRAEEPKENLIARLVDLTSNQKTVLARVIVNAPPETQQRFREALSNSETAHGRATILRERLIKPNIPQITPWQHNLEQKRFKNIVAIERGGADI